MAQERVAYINGEILPESEVKIPFRDRGFTAGDTVYDTARTFSKKIFQAARNTSTDFTTR